MVESESNAEKAWSPLESNPEIFSNYAVGLGYSEMFFEFHDVYSLDEEAFTTFLPQPVVAVVLCYEIKE